MSVCKKSSLPERHTLSARGILPVNCFCPDFVAYYEACPCLQASFCVVVQLVLPSVDSCRADVEARFLLALLAEFGFDGYEGPRVLREAYECKTFVQCQLAFLAHLEGSSSCQQVSY